MISIKNLKKSFGDNVIINDMNIDIESGDFVVFSGESGKGKTTMLNIIGGIEPFDEGEIEVEGFKLDKDKGNKKIYTETIGFLFQNFALIDDETVEQNLNLIDKKYRNDVSISEALELVGLGGHEDRKVYTLSGGEQQRVAIARLLIKKCKVILADEPTGSLDKKNGKKIIEYLLELNKMGKTVIMVTHDEEYKKIGRKIVNL